MPFVDPKARIWIFDKDNKVVYGGDFTTIEPFIQHCTIGTVMRARKSGQPVSSVIKINRTEHNHSFLHVGAFPYKDMIIAAAWSEVFNEGGIPKFKCTYESDTHSLLSPPQVTFSSFRDYRPVHIAFTLDNNVRCVADLPAASLAPFQPYGQLVVLVLSLFYEILGRLKDVSDDSSDFTEYCQKSLSRFDAKRIVILKDLKVIGKAQVYGEKDVSDETLVKFIEDVKPGCFQSIDNALSDDTRLFVSRLKGASYELGIIVEIDSSFSPDVYDDYALPFFSLCSLFIHQVNFSRKQALRYQKFQETLKSDENFAFGEIAIGKRKILSFSIPEYDGISLDEAIQKLEGKGFDNIRDFFDTFFSQLQEAGSMKQKICVRNTPETWYSVSAVLSFDSALMDHVATIVTEKMTQEKRQELEMVDSLNSVEDAMDKAAIFKFENRDGKLLMDKDSIYRFLGFPVPADGVFDFRKLVYDADEARYNELLAGKRAALRVNTARGTVHWFSCICTEAGGFALCTDSLPEISAFVPDDVQYSASESTVVFWVVHTSDDTVHPLFLQPTIWDVIGVSTDTHFSDFVDYIHPDDRESFTEGYSSILQSQRVQWAGEIRIMKAGTYEWHRIALAMSEDGIIHCLAMNTNKQREVECKLRETRQLRDLLLSSGKLALWKFFDNNDEAKILHEFTPGVVMGVEMNWTFLEKQVPEEFREHVTEELKRALNTGSTIESDFPITLDENSTIWVSVRGKGDASTRQVVGVCIDITELRDAYNRLEKERQRAEEANKQKTLFLANMSHEIRTPMNGIFGMLDVLSLQELTSEQRLLVDSIRSSSFQLMKLLDDTLHLSKIEQGETEPEVSNFDMWQLIEPTIIANYTSAKEKGVRLTLDVAMPFPSLFRADPQLFLKILNNLLSNAIKFTKQGHIDVKLSYAKEVLRLDVSDTGIGISKDQQQVIFERFAQADDCVARFFGGTGLGLALVQEIAKFLGGDVNVQSEVGKGSTFSVTLPMEEIMCPYAPTPKTAKTVLIHIEDALTRRMVVDSCHVLKYETKVISSVDEFQPNVNDSTVALFFESGHENVKMMKDVAERIGKVPVCAITDPGEVCIFKYSIPRPVMFHHVAKFLNGLKRGGNVQAPNVQIDNGTSRRILVVEDNKANQFVMKKILQNLHCTFRIAENGEEAIKILDEDEFDIVFMDCQMPVLDGLAATRKIRKSTDKKYHQIPIVALTASAVEGDEENCMEAGMDAYLAKPVRIQQITTVIRRFSQH